MDTETIDKQEALKKDWRTHPTSRTILILVTVWLVSNSLIILSATDLFTESFFNKRYVMMYLLMIFSTWTTLKVVLNYFKTRDK